jgi:hypothetical protein
MKSPPRVAGLGSCVRVDLGQGTQFAEERNPGGFRNGSSCGGEDRRCRVVFFWLNSYCSGQLLCSRLCRSRIVELVFNLDCEHGNCGFVLVARETNCNFFGRWVFVPLWIFHGVVSRGRFSLPAPTPPHDRHVCCKQPIVSVDFEFVTGLQAQ